MLPFSHVASNVGDSSHLHVLLSLVQRLSTLLLLLSLTQFDRCQHAWICDSRPFFRGEGEGGYKPGNLTRSMSLFSLSGIPVKSDDKIIIELMK